MNIVELLKQLHRIRPDAAYARRSREIILSGDVLRPAKLSPWQMIFESFESASALALVGLLLVLVGGGFSAWKFISPFHVASLDPASLKAEAQAIDMQIQLTDIDYLEKSGGDVTTPAVATPKKKQTDVVQKLVEDLGIATTTAPDVTSTIDDALDALSN